MLFSVLLDWSPIISLIFGGCCSNAITLEQLTSQFPHAGSLITCFQFVVISLYGLPRHLTYSFYNDIIPYPHLKPRQIPLAPYLAQVALFYLISLLNNAAFAYNIPMTVHIIFRSGGLVISMFLGWIIVGKSYSLKQVASVLMVTLGVMLTTLSASGARSSSQASSSSTTAYATGILILFLALVLSGFLGLVQDWTYRQQHTKKDSSQKPTWQESMFYLHFLSLPLFFFIRNDISSQFKVLNSAPPVTLQMRAWPAAITLPGPYIPLIVNTLTQLLCVAGVHRLTTRFSSLTVTLVLVVRKAVSLVLSVLLASSPTASPGKLWAGAALVFLGTVVYSLANKPPIMDAKKERKS